MKTAIIKDTDLDTAAHATRASSVNKVDVVLLIHVSFCEEKRQIVQVNER